MMRLFGPTVLGLVLFAAAPKVHASDEPRCGSGGDGSPLCSARLITPEVKAALERESDKAHLHLSLDEAITDEELKTITKLPWLTSVSLNRCDKITDITPLASLPKLAYVDLSGTSVKTLAPLAKLKNLTEIDLGSNITIEDLTPLKGLGKLKKLKLPMIKNIAPLAGLSSLRELELGTAPDDWGVVQKLVRLEVLKVSFVELTDLSVVGGLKDLRVLEISIGKRLADLSALKALTKLTSLRLQQTAVKDLAPLGGLTSLESLVVAQAPVEDIAPLASLTKLVDLNLSDTKVTSIAPLTKLTTLKTFGVTKTLIKDFKPLEASVPSLRTIWVPKGLEPQVAFIKQQNPKVSIFGM